MRIINILIGDTVCDKDNIRPMPPIIIEEPTMSMNFLVNKSPFAGKVAKYVTTRNIKDCLDKELEINVGLRLEPMSDSSADGFKVYCHGELYLAILIENMRREGYELAVSKPQVFLKQRRREIF